MRITAIEILKVPPSWVWLRIHTDEGISGLGEPYLENHPDTVIAEVRRLESLLIGRDPRDIERLWDDMYRSHFYYRGGPIKLSAISGIDMALWDIAGKAAGLPVHRLLGGPFRDRLQMYVGVTAGMRTRAVRPGEPWGPPGIAWAPSPWPTLEPQAWVESSRYWIEAGYRFLKLHVHLGPDLRAITAVDRVVALVGAVRESVGMDVQLAIDLAHPHASVATLIARELEPFRLAFVEDPQQVEQLATIADLVARSSLPIAAATAWTGKWSFLEAVNAGVKVVQPDVCHAGGITECKKIAAIAEAGHALVAMHTPMSVVALAASMQLHAAIPNFLVQEHNPVIASDPPDVAFGEGYLEQPLVRSSEGDLVVPDRPGLGIELDDAGMAQIMRMPWRVERG